MRIGRHIVRWMKKEILMSRMLYIQWQLWWYYLWYCKNLSCLIMKVGENVLGCLGTSNHSDFFAWIFVYCWLLLSFLVWLFKHFSLQEQLTEERRKTVSDEDPTLYFHSHSQSYLLKRAILSDDYNFHIQLFAMYNPETKYLRLKAELLVHSVRGSV